MSKLIAHLGQLFYPLRKQLIRLFNPGATASNKNSRMTTAKTIYNFSIEGIDGNEIDFNKFLGKKILLVNTASQCGFTPQYDGLQKLSELFKNKLVVIGFPSNNFGAQEPGNDNEILNFCKRNYGVNFPLTKKIDVTGANKHEIFKWITEEKQNGWNNRDPNWNFCKYLVNEEGYLTDFFSHKLDPMDQKIISKIET